MTDKFTNENAIFAGKVASFSTADETLALKNIKLEIIANRIFLTGEFKAGTKPGKPPTKSNKTTIAGGEEGGTVLKRDGQ